MWDLDVAKSRLPKSMGSDVRHEGLPLQTRGPRWIYKMSEIPPHPNLIINSNHNTNQLLETHSLSSKSTNNNTRYIYSLDFCLFASQHNPTQSIWLARMSWPQRRSTSLSLLLWPFPKTSLMTRRASMTMMTTPRLVCPIAPMTRTAPPRHLTLLAIPATLTTVLVLAFRLVTSRLAQAS